MDRLFWDSSSTEIEKINMLIALHWTQLQSLVLLAQLATKHWTKSHWKFYLIFFPFLFYKKLDSLWVIFGPGLIFG